MPTWAVSRLAWGSPPSLGDAAKGVSRSCRHLLDGVSGRWKKRVTEGGPLRSFQIPQRKQWDSGEPLPSTLQVGMAAPAHLGERLNKCSVCLSPPYKTRAMTSLLPMTLAIMKSPDCQCWAQRC